MCEAHQHATDTTEAPAHDHGHDHGSHDHGNQGGGHTHGGGHSHSAPAGADAADTAECPVMRGSFIAKADAEAQGLVREYKGEKYYLCCAACGPLFDADPEKYVSAL